LSLTRFLATSIVITMASLAATASINGDVAVRQAVACGAVIALGNALLSCGLVKLVEHRSPNVFMGIVLWGMAGRLASMAGLMVFGVRWFALPAVPLAASLLSHFSILLALELAAFHRMRIPGGEAA
jgi:hypothetical protein